MPFERVPHPWQEKRKQAGPVKVEAHRGGGVNARVGLLITTLVGTMYAGYLFTAIALISLPSAIRSGNLTVIIAWLSSNFLQLVLLPVVIVGQSIQAKAADARAEQTYRDAELVLHEAQQIQDHLAVQDDRLSAQDAVLGSLADTLVTRSDKEATT